MFFGAKMFAAIVWCDVGVRLDWIGRGRLEICTGREERAGKFFDEFSAPKARPCWGVEASKRVT